MASPTSKPLRQDQTSPQDRRSQWKSSLLVFSRNVPKVFQLYNLFYSAKYKWIFQISWPNLPIFSFFLYWSFLRVWRCYGVSHAFPCGRVTSMASRDRKRSITNEVSEITARWSGPRVHVVTANCVNATWGLAGRWVCYGSIVVLPLCRLKT